MSIRGGFADYSELYQLVRPHWLQWMLRLWWTYWLQWVFFYLYDFKCFIYLWAIVFTVISISRIFRNKKVTGLVTFADYSEYFPVYWLQWTHDGCLKAWIKPSAANVTVSLITVNVLFLQLRHGCQRLPVFFSTDYSEHRQRVCVWPITDYSECSAQELTLPLTDYSEFGISLLITHHRLRVVHCWLQWTSPLLFIILYWLQWMFNFFILDTTYWLQWMLLIWPEVRNAWRIPLNALSILLATVNVFMFPCPISR